MNKLAIMMDSFSGFTQKQLKDLGIEMVSQTIIVDGHQYKEGIDITIENVVKILEGAKDVKSSMPAIGLVSEKMKELSEANENVLYITMNKAMSSTFSTGMAASSEFDNVHVINGGALISSMLVEGALICKKLADEGKGIKEIIKTFENLSETAQTFIVVKDTTNLLKSGRVGAAKKLLMEKVKLIPRLQVLTDGFKSAGTKRNFQKAIKSTIDKVIENIGGVTNKGKYSFHVASTTSEETDTMVRGALNFNGIKEIKFTPVAAATLGHTGVGSFGIGAMLKK